MLNIQNLISLMCCSKSRNLAAPSALSAWQTLLLPRESVNREEKQWSMVLFSCSLPHRVSLTPLALQHRADSWVFTWKQGAESQGSGNYREWGERARKGQGGGLEGGGRARWSCLFLAIVNPLEFEMEISYINMHCIIPSSEAKTIFIS